MIVNKSLGFFGILTFSLLASGSASFFFASRVWLINIENYPSSALSLCAGVYVF
jgi:hypothetical protein